MRFGRKKTACSLAASALAASLLLTGAATAAAPGEAPTITDPDGDTKHREFGWEEPTLDVTEVTFGWTDGTLEIAVLLPHAETLGPEGTMDPLAPGTQMTYVDVYWSMAGADYLARAVWNPEGEVAFEAGQGMRVHRQVMWEAGDDIHGETTAQAGEVEAAGDGHRVTIRVDPAAVGSPGPGDVLEAPAFSSYIDHHQPVFMEDWPGPHPFGPHHPANADVNDAPGLAYRVPLGAAAADAVDSAASDAARLVPAAPAGVALLVIGLVAALRRR